jgi:catechol 2,3-dioxygenase-like lactoylglutathione lyase family enzyme
LLTATDQHELLFSGSEGQILTITVHRLDGATFDPYVNIITPDGVEWDESNNINRTTRDAQIVGVELPEDGFYTITVANAIEQGSGEYLIAVGEGITSRDVEEGTPAYDEAVVDAIENYGVRDVWTIDVDSEQLISVSVEVVEEESEFDPLLEIVDPTGESLAFDDDSGSNKNAILFRVPAPTTGTYRLHIAAFDSATVGSYRLWWILEEADVLATPTEAPTGDTESPTGDEGSEADTSSTLLDMRGSLDAEVAGDAFYDRQIDLEEEQTITIYVEGYASFDPILEVLDADGNLVERVDDVGFDATYDINPRLTLIIENSGRYTLRVYGYEDSGGEFSLNWQVR